LGRLLPREVRERIFEPAFWDVLHERLSDDPRRTHLPFAFHACGLWVGCLPIATPRLFVKDGNLTRLSRGVLWSVAVAAAVVLIFVNVVRPYLGYTG
jgi:hypothetical protein